jgi:hypothetical protein
MAVFHTIFAAKIATEGPYVVAFTAPKGTGKDTTARRLHEIASTHEEIKLNEVLTAVRDSQAAGPWHEAFKLGLYRIDKCAATLYRMVAELIGWTPDQLDGPAKETIWTADTAPTPTLVGWSPRKLLEQLGSNFVRDRIGRDHWVQLLKARLDKHQNGITVITDCRFINEAQLADLVIELRREGKDYDERPDDQGGHESRRRLPAHLIDFTYHLTPDMDYHLFADDLILKVERKRLIRADFSALEVAVVTSKDKAPPGVSQAAWDAAGKPTMIAPQEREDGYHLGIERGDA